MVPAETLMRVGSGRKSLIWLLLTLSVLLLALGGIAGTLNRTVVNGQQFANKIDQIRQDPQVAAQLGTRIADEVVAKQPDLQAVKPLLAGTASALVSSTFISKPVQIAVENLHAALTNNNSNQVIFRLADLGAAITAALQKFAPEVAKQIPPDLGVTLAQFGSQEFTQPLVTTTRLAKVLSWLLPILGLLGLAGVVFLTPSKRRGLLRAGLALAVAGGVLGLLIIIGSIYASIQGDSTLKEALIGAGWDAFGVPLALPFVAYVLLGGVIAVGAAARLPNVNVSALASQAFGVVKRRPSTTRAAIARSLIFIAIGIFAIFKPLLLLQFVAVIAGIAIALVGVGEIDRVAVRAKARDAGHPMVVDAQGNQTPALHVELSEADTEESLAQGYAPVSSEIESQPSTRESPDPNAPRNGRMLAGFGAVAVIGMGAIVAVQVLPLNSNFTSSTAAPLRATVCNGHAELCSRPYNEVAFPAAHNAMSAADEPGWFLAEQPTGLTGGLKAGVRALLFDTWYGQPTQKGVATVAGDANAAEAQAKATFGPETYDAAMRVVASVRGKATGPARAYMCHTLCELGATELEPAMKSVKKWMDDNPQEVVSFFIQDVVTPGDTAKVLQQAGLTDYAFTPTPGAPWPTLGQMVESGKRLVILMEEKGGGIEYPYLLQGFDYVQETPYTFKTVADFNCEPNRGPADAPLLQVNHWLSGFKSLVSDSRKVNAYDVLWPRVEACRKERKMIPNFVAVNYYNEGDLFGVVNKLNGVS